MAEQKTKTDLILEKLDTISQKLDLALKALNLVPVSEDEELKIRAMRESNAQIKEKVYSQIHPDTASNSELLKTFNIADSEIYADVVGGEFSI